MRNTPGFVSRKVEGEVKAVRQDRAAETSRNRQEASQVDFSRIDLHVADRREQLAARRGRRNSDRRKDDQRLKVVW